MTSSAADGRAGAAVASGPREGLLALRSDRKPRAVRARRLAALAGASGRAGGPVRRPDGRFTGATRSSLYTSRFQRPRLGEERFRSDLAFAELMDASRCDRAAPIGCSTWTSTYLPGDLLVKVDIASMAHSLEVRSPLLDHRFMEMAAGLPGPEARRHDRKRIFKDCFGSGCRTTPRSAQAGLSVRSSEWLRGPLGTLTAEVLLDPASLDRGLFDEGALRALVEDHRSGAADNSKTLWSLLQLELWYRTYIDRAGLEPLANLGM